MLQRLRSRHSVDLPYGTWGRKRGILAVLGGIAILFVLIPLAFSPLVALNDSARKAVIAVAVGVGTLFVVLVAAGARGKFGWQR